MFEITFTIPKFHEDDNTDTMEAVYEFVDRLRTLTAINQEKCVEQFEERAKNGDIAAQNALYILDFGKYNAYARVVQKSDHPYFTN